MRAGRDGGAGVERREELADRLDVVAEELGDMALESLRAALERGDTSRPAEEKRLTQARRAVEKAAHLLRSIDGLTGSDDETDDIDARRTEGPTSSEDVDGLTGSDDGTADG